MERLLALAAVFATASVLSFGGGNAILPELQRQTVSVHGWLRPEQFADCFAIAQVAPGPSTLLVTLLGDRAAGLPGALVATLATVLPSSALMVAAAGAWLRTGRARWHAALEHGLAPLGVGLVAASGILVARTVDTGVGGAVITAAATLALLLTRISPLWVVLGGGGAGLLLL